MTPKIRVALARGRVQAAVFNFEDQTRNMYANLAPAYRYGLGILKRGISYREFYMYAVVLFRVNGASYYARGANKKRVSGYDPSRTCAEMEALDNMEEFIASLDTYPNMHEVRVDFIMNFGDVQPDDGSGEMFEEGTCSCGHCRREFLVHKFIDIETTHTVSTVLPSARFGKEIPQKMFISTPKELAERFGTLPKQGSWRS